MMASWGSSAMPRGWGRLRKSGKPGRTSREVLNKAELQRCRSQCSVIASAIAPQS
ncbi:hypothetical protein KWH19_05930 [Xanthomonas campestris pv. pennamericanum]|uniref:hypothetical protein n=1 Tax=Xanthomonas euvesicatoria TaxID=456327 RepID=UPI001C4523ED|nr:hypothetical protein [Xanthomonas euvesicatoria]MBV6809362.1 hypothetical protein [Xanthomonas campestris pv. pennamericanum]